MQNTDGKDADLVQESLDEIRRRKEKLEKFGDAELLRQKNELAEAEVLTADDIFGGGEEPFKAILLPSVIKGGKPGKVYVADLSTGDVFRFLEIKDSDDPVKQNELVLSMISKTVVNERGERIFSDADDVERMKKLSIRVFSILAKSVTEAARESIGQELSGNVSSGDLSFASPSG